MKTNRWFLVGLLTACLTCSSVHAQINPYKPSDTPPPPIPNGRTDYAPNQNVAPSGGLSDWILYHRDCCDGRPGKVTPLYTELYLRAGPSIPIGSGTLSRESQVGWSIVGGGRALFFNQSMTSAWTVDPHIINTNESGGALNTAFPVTILSGPNKSVFGANGVPGVTIRASNRTMVGLGIGREFYLWEPADSPGSKCRVGVDGGGRYGSIRVDLNETRRLTDTIGSMFFAVHSDYEIPCKYGLFHTGIRVEWSYTWSDVLQQSSDAQDINVFWTVGMRF